MDTWIVFTIGAAFFQNLRSALQKHIKGKLSTLGAAYSRFLYALPFSAVYLLVIHYTGDSAYPDPTSLFLFYCLLGGLSQILFTVVLLWLFSFKSFAVGTTFSKLEVIMVAVLGALVIGDSLNTVAIIAIVISSLGVLALSMGQNSLTVHNIASAFTHRTTFIGLLCAALLGGSVVFFRAASLTLNHTNFVMGAAYTLFISLVIQTVLMGVYIFFREPGQLGLMVKHWRPSMLVGLAGVLASIGWFTAFTIQNASYVRALGQIELVFTFIATVFFFKESELNGQSTLSDTTSCTGCKTTTKGIHFRAHTSSPLLK
ncbi:MAG: EamA family transporter, partial [Pseudomonadota bacterium]